LPVVDGGLLYVEPVYASPGASDASSSYPRLIRVAMMYNDKIAFEPTVSEALTALFGQGAGVTATGPAPTDLPDGQPQASPPNGQPPNAPAPNPQQGRAPEVPVPVAVPGAGPTQLSAAKAAALQEVSTAMANMRTAQESGDFAEFGQALQALDDAVTKYQQTR